MKMTLAALEEIADEVFSPYDNTLGEAILALRAAIERAQPDELMIWKSRAMSAERIIEKFMQPEQEPVAWMWADGTITNDPDRADGTWKPLYIAPRQWQGLTDEERNSLWRNAIGWGDPSHNDEDLMKAIEAKLKEKNT